MLVNMNDVLYRQKRQIRSRPFNAVNLELARGIIAAAENSVTGHHGNSGNILPYGPTGNESLITLSLWLRKQMFRLLSSGSWS